LAGAAAMATATAIGAATASGVVAAGASFVAGSSRSAAGFVAGVSSEAGLSLDLAAALFELPDFDPDGSTVSSRASASERCPAAARSSESLRAARSAAALLRDRLSSAATEASSERRCAVERSCARSADVSVGALLSTRAAKLSFPGDGADLGGGGAWKDRLVGSDVTLNSGGLSIFHLSYRQQGPGHPGFQKRPFNFNGLSAHTPNYRAARRCLFPARRQDLPVCLRQNRAA
jgi:hypothetical protein